ncbi:hypothetical protein AMTRI_Chr03g143440 [Amborella trichopoda]|uniref:Uncharacterized protein n=1 Tax=Amborella trichopoda TaxID=13333 RepID=W1NGR6_AMBTC|nr:hypothetical protein AMTR_s00011p00211110 [Amborella trichopoda]
MSDKRALTAGIIPATFRAIRSKTSVNGYHRLGREAPRKAIKIKNLRFPVKAKKVAALPSNILKPTQKTTGIHPVIDPIVGKGKKKVTSRPEICRYLEYLREGGSWEIGCERPVIYFS